MCIENYKLIKDNYNNKNCKIKCPYYYYFDEDGNYNCTESNKCPINFNKIIENEDKCIDKCINDDAYRLEYEDKCVSECPQYTYNDNNICEIDLNEILKYKTNDDRMKLIQNYLENVNPDKIKEKLKNQEHFIYRYNDMNTIITNLDDEFKIKNNSLSIIDLNECEFILKDIAYLSLLSPQSLQS